VRKVYHVAVGIIVDAQGRVLISKRLPHQLAGGFWEFPGGKIENNETAEEALVRELQEEIGIKILKFCPIMEHYHDYAKHNVSALLTVFVVTSFKGEPKGLEGQEIRWISENEFSSFNFLEANKKVIEVFLLKQWQWKRA
jgi:8-oxo-dGTP diphosphatase